MHVLNGQKMQMRKEACRTFCCICHAPTLCQCDCTGSDNPDLSLCTTLKVTLYLVCKCKNGFGFTVGYVTDYFSAQTSTSASCCLYI